MEGVCMKRFHLWLILVTLPFVLLTACGEKLTEEQMRARALDYENKEQWDKAVETYETMLQKFSESENRDETLYKLGVLYANNLKEYEKAIKAYKTLVEKYPDSPYCVKSSFMIGFLYANDLKDLDRAKAAYEEFLQKWPNDELAPSVEWELEHLGQDISEIQLGVSENDQ
ncbi:tetratricopeptide repeat protein [candidate division KSB1 bacterium]|nr:tetratricopeptide repeat protein [candidate division KSB1 bacterium]